MTAEVLKEHETLYETMNPLRRFLKYGNVVTDENYWVPVNVFLTEFNHFCTNHGAQRSAWTEDLYDSVFRQLHLQVKNARFFYETEDVMQSGAVVIGCTFNDCIDKMSKVDGQDNPDYIDD